MTRYLIFSTLMILTIVTLHACNKQEDAKKLVPKIELNYHDIPHHYYKNFGYYFDLDLLEDGTYHLSKNAVMSLEIPKDSMKYIPFCIAGQYKLDKGYLELLESEDDEIIIGGSLLKDNIHRFYKIIQFDTVTILVPSTNKFSGNFDSDAWNLELISLLNKDNEKNITSYSFTSKPQSFPAKDYLLSRKEITNKIAKEYQHYLKDSIHLKVINLDKNYIVSRNKRGEYVHHITFNLDKGSKDGILKNMDLFPRKSPVFEIRNKLFFCANFRYEKLLVTKVYPKKCEAIMFIRHSMLQEECFDFLEDYSTFAEIK